MENPSSFVLNLLAKGKADYHKHYVTSSLHESNEKKITEMLEGKKEEEEEGGGGPNKKEGDDRRVLLEKKKEQEQESNQRFAASFSLQFQYLFVRSLLEYIRTPTFSFLGWLLLFFFSVVIGTTMLNQNLATASGVQSRVGMINVALILASNYNTNTIIPFVYSHRRVFERERSGDMYSAKIYAIVTQLIQDPFLLVELLISCTTIYLLIGFAPSADAYFLLCFYEFLFCQFGGK